MPQSLENQLSAFLRKRRGDQTYEAFGRKLGLSSSNLHRLELGMQTVTLRTVQQIKDRLKCTLADMFSEESFNPSDPDKAPNPRSASRRSGGVS